MVGRVTLPKLSRKVGLRSHSRTESVDARVLALELAKLPSVDEALDAIAATYKTVAGFDPEALNNRPSFSAHRA